jgi:hypothetical protein
VITRLPLPEFRPDQTIASGVLTDCRNAIPAADDSYRPLRAISTISSALAASFLGGASAIASDGTGYLLAGTAAALYKFNAGSWTSVVGSLTIASRWRFAQFGNFVVAVNGSDTREIDLSDGSDEAIADAPAGTSVAVVGDHVVIGQPDGKINEVSWSAFGDHTGWTAGTDQSGNQPMQTGGAVQGIAGGEYGIILQRERIVRMTRTGDALAPFQFDEVSANFGCSNGSTIAQAGRTVFFHSDRGFMALDDGQALRPIGSEKVDRSFEAEVGRDNFGAIYCAVDPVNKLVFWGVPGSPGKLWIYNFELDRWATGVFPFTGFMAGFTTSTGLETLAVTHTDLDAMTISLDDARWSGGHPRLYFFDAERKIGTLTGDTLAAQFKMAFAELITGQRATVSAVRPITDATEGVTVILDARARLGDAQNTVSHGTILPSGVIPIRSSGRYHAPTLQFDAGTEWSYARGLEIECQPGGTR